MPAPEIMTHCGAAREAAANAIASTAQNSGFNGRCFSGLEPATLPSLHRMIELLVR